MSTPDDEHRPTLRSYDEFEGRRKKRKKQSSDESARKPTAREPDDAKVTEDALREAALRYLDRQDASVHQVRTILKRRVFKYAKPEGRAEATERVESILGRLVEARVLDDARYARAYAESLRLRGASRPKLLQKLGSRGLADDVIKDALDGISEDDRLSDEEAARTYARKRRLRERYDLTDSKERQKALAALARQGFSFDIARRVLGL